MPNYIPKVNDSFFGGFTSVDNIVESYIPKDKAVWNRYVQLVSEGRVAEACRMQHERVQEAMVDDDLPVILGGSVDTHLYKAFDSVSENWRIPFRPATFNNFRRQNVAVLEDLLVDEQQAARTSSGTIPMVPEGHGYDDARIEEEYEYAEIETYGILFRYTRQMLFNDDQRALQAIPAVLGAAMKRTINKHVANCLEAGASTSTSGMVMRDGSRLFNTTAPAGSCINMYSAAAPLNYTNLITYMHYFANLPTPQGRIMNLRPKYLIVPPELQYTAERLCGVNAGVRMIAGATTTTLEPDTTAPVASLTPVYLEELTSPVDWYLAADPLEFPTIEVGFLNGRDRPELFQQDETGKDLQAADGITYKIRHDFDVYAVSRRGILKVDDTT